MNTRQKMIIALTGCAAMSSPAWGQYSRSSGPGWEFGIDAVYLDSAELSFDGGSSASVEDDLGVALAFGYRFNSRVELQLALDWSDVDYDATLQSATVPGLAVDVRGEFEAFTPRINGNYNFLDGNLTPYVTAGIGWTFIDTNIPSGQVEVGCWWDPWYGEICTPYQETRTTDGFAYQVGAGVRWDPSRIFSLRLGYERHWYELDNASGTPDFDHFKVGVVFLY